MSAFFVVVKIFAPYPVERSHTIKASSAATASARAIRDTLKDVLHKRRIEYYSLTIKKL